MKQEVVFFIQSVQHKLNKSFTEEDELQLQIVAAEHMENLTTIRTGFFRSEDLPQISKMAAEKLSEVKKAEPTLSLMEAWHEVVRDFHANQYWGFQTLREKPKVEKKKSEMASFLWTLFQAAVVMKFIVLYFGINAAEQDDERHYWALGVAIFVSFASLLFFAWRKSKNYKD